MISAKKKKEERSQRREGSDYLDGVVRKGLSKEMLFEMRPK